MTKRKSDIEKRLNRRSASYDRSTKAIFTSISGVISAIETYARQEDLLNDDTTLQLISIDMDEEDHVVLSGVFKPNIGATVMSTLGQYFDIESEEDQFMYGKILRMSVSLDIIELNDHDTTLKYIIDGTEKLKQFMEEMNLEEMELEEMDSEESFEVDGPLSLDDNDRDDEKLRKILAGATNPSGVFN